MKETLKALMNVTFMKRLSVNWDAIISLDNNDPNLAINNFYNHINLLLDNFAP